MSSSLSTQMLTAYDNSNSRAAQALKNYISDPKLSDQDTFNLVVKKQFFIGVHTAFLEAILQALTKELKTQQRVAEALGLKDRTSISQMIRSGLINGIRITAALYQYPHLVKYLPTRERAALSGFATATSFIKAQAYSNVSIEGTMSPQDFSYLIGVLAANNEWESALRNPDPRVVRNIAMQIVRERGITFTHPATAEKRRPEQYVLMLQELCASWADFAVLALWAIPECIPEDETGEEAML
jgi:hypothetical protein